MTTQPDASRFGVSPRRRSQAVIGAGFVIPLLVYLRTLAPTVLDGDSGELITSAYLLGVPHPTGYPLYMLLARGFQFLPVGSIAYRTNLFSAVCMAAMCAVLAWAYLQAGGSRPGALLAALTAAFVNLVWSQAVRAEVYALNALLVVAIVGSFIRWQHTRGSRALVVLAAVSGLALTHHRTAVFFAAPFLGAALLLHRPLPGRLLAKVAGAFFLPLLLYLYLPIRAGAVAVANWGDPGTLRDFVNHVTGTQYYVYLARPRDISPQVFLAQGLVRSPAAQFTPAGLALALAGWGALFWSRRTLWATSTIAVALTAGLAARYSVSDAPVLLLPVYLVLAACLAVGTEAAARGLSAARFLTPRLRRTLSVVLLLGLAAALPTRLVWAHWSQQDLSRVWRFYDAGQVMFAEAEPDSLVVLSGDSMNGVAMYLQAVEKRRPDVQVVWAEHAGHAWHDRDLPLPALAPEAARARRAFLAGEAPPGQSWATYFTRRVALRCAQSRPTHTNLTLSDLPMGYWVLEGRAIDRILPAAPDLLTADAPDLAMRTESLFGQVTWAQVPQLALHRAASGMAWRWGVVLLLAESEPEVVSPGEVFRVRYYWRCDEPLEEPLSLRVDFVNAGWLLRQKFFGAQPPPHLGFVADSPLIYGVMPLVVNPRGSHYEQVVHYVAARDVPPGPYLLRASLKAPGVQAVPVAVARVDLEAAP